MLPFLHLILQLCEDYMTTTPKVQEFALKTSIDKKYRHLSRSKIHDLIIAKCSRNTHLYRFGIGDGAPTMI